ncbi:MAG: hypothetical protein KFH87_07030 [Bacteroidetes bacterium]|nr:hypothetical protein [Bacteroidota bacterium]
MYTRILTTLVLLCIAASPRLYSQDTPVSPTQDNEHAPWRLGISAGVFFSMHSGGFSFPEDCATCGNYEDANGLGSAFDLRASIPLVSWLRLEPRLYGECHRGVFTSAPIESEIIGSGLQPQDVVFEDELRYTHRLIGIELLGSVALGRSGIALLLGPALGMSVSETATVTERIVSPSGVVFADGTSERVMHDDEVALARDMHAGLRFGAGYTLPLSRDLALGIEATWLLPLTTVTETDDWTTTGLRGLVTILFCW